MHSPASTIAIAGPFLFAAASAIPMPSQWKFTAAAILGAVVGAFARLSIALFSDQIQQRVKGLYLALASFWLGIIGALAAYLSQWIDGNDSIKVTAVAALASLFGLVIEVLTQRYIKAKAKGITDEIKHTGPTAADLGFDPYTTDRLADFKAAVARDQTTQPDKVASDQGGD